MGFRSCVCEKSSAVLSVTEKGVLLLLVITKIPSVTTILNYFSFIFFYLQYSPARTLLHPPTLEGNPCNLVTPFSTPGTSQRLLEKLLISYFILISCSVLQRTEKLKRRSLCWLLSTGYFISKFCECEAFSLGISVTPSDSITNNYRLELRGDKYFLPVK